MQQPPSRKSDNPSTLEINNPTTEIFTRDEHSHSGGGNYNLRLNPNPNTQKYTDIDVNNFLFQPLSCVILILQFYFFFAHIIQFLFFSILGANPYKY